MSRADAFTRPHELPAATERCRSCHTPVRWALNATTQKPAPIDATPAEDGNVHVFTAGARLYYAVLAKPEERAAAAEHGTPLYNPHFRTCPQRDEWRKAS